MSLFASLAIFVFVIQLQSRLGLNKELDTKKEELQDAQTASQRMEDLERKGQELKLKENKIKKQVAVGDTQPLGLIKTITGSASKMGLRKISFELKTDSANTSKGKLPLSSSAGSGPALLYFQMKFAASFNQILEFLKELNSLERIVTVEKIEIDRKTEILPYQSVVLDLITYSYPE
jgi:Tfp pilus assembly protein PilO